MVPARPELVPLKSSDYLPTAQFLHSNGSILTTVSKSQLGSPMGSIQLPSTHFPKKKNHEKKLLLIKLEGTLLAVPSKTETFGYIFEDSIDKKTDGNESETYKRINKMLYPRLGLKAFLKNASNYCNIIVYSSFKTKMMKILLQEHEITSYIKGYIGGVSSTETISGIVLGTALQGKLKLQKTLLLDSDKHMIDLNSQNGILVQPAAIGSKDNDLFNCLPFLYYLSQKSDVRPIYTHYKEYLRQGNFNNQANQDVNNANQDANNANQEGETNGASSDRCITLRDESKFESKSIQRLKDKIERGHLSRVKLHSQMLTSMKIPSDVSLSIGKSLLIGCSDIFSRSAKSTPSNLV